MQTSTPSNAHGSARCRGRHLLFLLSLILLAGCASKDLHDWQTERLTSEFTAKDADTVQTLDDYLALEDELFAELEEKVYIPKSTENMLVRYSKGSLSDPSQYAPNWNRSYVLPVENPIGGALLLHGLSDSPYSLRAAALELHERGYYVVGMRMPGHGTAPSGLLHVHWRDMAAALDLGMAHLSERLPDKPIHIIGYSTGASLALDYALRVMEGTASPKPASMVLISPAVGVTAAAGLAKIPKGLSKVPSLGGLGYTEVEVEFDPYKYNSFTANAGDLVYKVTRSVSGRLDSKSAEELLEGMPPLLIFQSTVDATVSTKALIDKLLRHLDPGRHELVLFDINRFGANYLLLTSDPGPLTNQLIADTALPFAVTLVGNRDLDSMDVVAVRKRALEGTVSSVEDLELEWPPGVISLSHVALPIATDDPLYGDTPPANRMKLFLGEINIKGEKNLLLLPPSFLLRLRHNPFYDYLERRTVNWMAEADAAHAAAR